MDEKQFEQEYKTWKRQDAPELWDKIEPRLQDHTEEPKKKRNKIRLHNFMHYGISAAAAVVVVALIFPGIVYWKKTVLNSKNGDTAGEKRILEETTSSEEGAISEKNIYSEKKTYTGLYNYRQLGLKEGNPLSVPDNAVSVSEDIRYFSEEVLGDTELLCSGTVEEVSLEYDNQQRAVNVVYQVNLDTVHYAQDYISSSDRITIKSPIVTTKGDETYLLYQMQTGGRYLLPLKKEGADWELIFPFAPQIQITQDGGYVFHSGYASLMNHDTHVVLARQEGTNDYFYDRMLLREDGEFLLEFLELMEQQIKEKM